MIRRRIRGRSSGRMALMADNRPRELRGWFDVVCARAGDVLDHVGSCVVFIHDRQRVRVTDASPFFSFTEI